MRMSVVSSLFFALSLGFAAHTSFASTTESALDESSISFEHVMALEAGAEMARHGLGFRCCAGDVGFEEHGDHCVQAVTRIGGEARAIQLCQTLHGRCLSYGCQQN